jgi:hypothetical protein
LDGFAISDFEWVVVLFDGREECLLDLSLVMESSPPAP